MHKLRIAVRFDCEKEVVPATGRESLHLIPSGSLPARPLNLPGNLRMKALLDEVRQGYHYVIPDTPPPNWYLIFWC
jgi:Mrp family chromosome partitioning ATPase